MMRKNSSKLKKIGITMCLCGVLCGSIPAPATYAQTVKPVALENKISAICKREDITKEERNAYFSQSAFIGNSIGVGQKMYFDSKGTGFLGNPKMLVRGCYSFLNDKNLHSQFSLMYGGRHCYAKDAIAMTKAKRVFINMGINDLWKDADSTYLDYVDYIKGIQNRNPGVVIFIESTTPMCSSRNGKYLNNSAINRLNSKMERYCKSHKNLYYVDVTKGMRDATGGLKNIYASDGYVHISMAGYELWTNNLVEYVEKLLAQEKTATRMVEIVKHTKSRKDYNRACEYVSGLEKSTTKTQLTNRLKRLKKGLY